MSNAVLKTEYQEELSNSTFVIKYFSSKELVETSSIKKIEVSPFNEPAESIEKSLVRKNLKSTFTEIKSNEDEVVSSYVKSSYSDHIDIYESKKLEDEFYCVISSVNKSTKELEARVYDKTEKIQVMDLCIPFSSFKPNEVSKIKENAVFYWSIGTRTKKVKSKKSPSGFSEMNENFSEYRMRLSYVSKRAVKERLATRIEKFEQVFS